MESAEAQVRYAIFTTVVKTEERFRDIHVSGVGGDVVKRRESIGWYVHLQGSYEALHLGFEKPAFAHGDKIKITFERIDDAKVS